MSMLVVAETEEERERQQPSKTIIRRLQPQPKPEQQEKALVALREREAVGVSSGGLFNSSLRVRLSCPRRFELEDTSTYIAYTGTNLT